MKLYEHQEKVITELRKSWNRHKRTIAVLPTGAGKTIVSGYLIQKLEQAKKQVIFVVPRIALIKQTYEKFCKMGVKDIDYLWTDHDTNYNARVIIASIDSMIRRDKELLKPDLFIIDEVHIKRQKLLTWMKDDPEQRYLGLTATPFAPWLGSYFTHMIKGPSMRYLIDNNFLSDYEVFAPSSPNLKGVRKTNTATYGSDYNQAELEEVMNGAKIVGNIVDNWLKHGENRITIVLCINVLHANHLCNEFEKNGVAAEVVTANVPYDERELIFERMRKGLTRVCLSVNALNEGLDIPEISCVINARPTVSKARYIQGIGRGLRYIKGKTCIIFDHSGTSIALGLPCDVSIPDFDTANDGMDEINRTKKDRDYEDPKPKKCPKCGYLKPPKVSECPKCGFKPRRGEDVEVDETRGLELTKGNKKQYSKKDKQQFYAELLGYQNNRKLIKPVKDGYLYHIFKSKFGESPPKGKIKPCNPSPSTLNFIKHRQIANAKAWRKRK